MQKKRSLPSWVPTALVALAAFLLIALAKAFGLISMYWYQVIEFAAITAISSLGLNLIYGFNGQFSLGHVAFYAIGAYGSALISKDFLTKWSGARVGALSWIIAAQIGLVLVIFILRWLRLNSMKERLAHLLAGYLKPYESWLVIGAILLIPVVATIGMGTIATWGLQKLLLVALGPVLQNLPSGIAQNLVFFLALINGGTLAALASYLVGLPLLRLGSDYFGIATLGFAIMAYTALQNSDLVIPTMKGARGMVGIPRWSTWPWVFATLVVSVILIRNLIHSSYGRAIMSVREDETAAETMGIDVAQLKGLSFTLGGFFAGLAGALYAHLFAFLHPSSFNMIKGFDPLIIIVFGGLGSMTGTIVASVMFALIIEGLRVVLPQGFEDWRFVIYPIILLLIMLLRQQGLLGTTEWGWLRAPSPPERDAPSPDGAAPDDAEAIEGEGA